METTFLEYYKTVLEKVSFDHHLFTKEYYKALSKLRSNEVNALNVWLTSKGFQPIVPDTVHSVELLHRNEPVDIEVENVSNRSGTINALINSI